MALEGTHIRFAAALKDKLKIVDVDKFIAGTVYPDSRYLTGVQRELTHKDVFLTNDFNKGWSVHCSCDKIQREVLAEFFPLIMNDENRGRWFVNFSALKNVQDLYEMKNFDIQPYLKCLDYSDNPNQEDIKKVTDFNKMVQRMYNTDDLTIESFRTMWASLGLKAEVVDEVIETTLNFVNDKNITTKIEKVFDKMLLYYNHI